MKQEQRTTRAAMAAAAVAASLAISAPMFRTSYLTLWMRPYSVAVVQVSSLVWISAGISLLIAMVGVARNARNR